MSDYNFSAIEKKWQKYWLENKTFKTDDSKPGEKFYCLDMFPYPSGAGLHVGHPEGYTATDILCRYKRMKGFNVLHPMGWDAFGLPAEQYAVETGTHPAVTTKKNVDRFREQIRSLGFSYDWDREVNTTIRSTTSGRSGSSRSFTRRGSPTSPKCRLTGARRSGRCLRTKRSSTGAANAATIPSSVVPCASGCSRSPSTPSVC